VRLRGWVESVGKWAGQHWAGLGAMEAMPAECAIIMPCEILKTFAGVRSGVSTITTMIYTSNINDTG